MACVSVEALAPRLQERSFARRLRKRQGGFVRLSAPELLSLCMPKEKVAKEKRHPDGAPCAHPWAPGARAGSGVFRRHLRVPAENWLASMRAILTDFPSPTRRAIGTPGRAARSRRALSEKPKCRELAALLLLARTMRARFSGAPSATVRRGRQGRAAGEPTDGLAFSRGQEPARIARPRPTDFPSMDGRKASPRGVVFSWLLLFDSGHPALRPCGPASLFACAPAHAWTSKREVAPPPTGGRNRSDTCVHAEAKAPLTPTLSPNDEAVGGEGKLWDPASGRERVCSPRRMPPLIPSRSPSTTHPGNAAAWKETAPAPAAR